MAVQNLVIQEVQNQLMTIDLVYEVAYEEAFNSTDSEMSRVALRAKEVRQDFINTCATDMRPRGRS